MGEVVSLGNEWKEVLESEGEGEVGGIGMIVEEVEEVVVTSSTCSLFLFFGDD